MGRGAVVQMGHKEIAVRDGESPRYFFFATSKVNAPLYVTLGSHISVLYGGARKRLLEKAFLIEEVEAVPALASVDHGYVQHANSEWRGEHCIRYHSYLVSENQGLLDKPAFTYGESTVLGSRKGRENHLKEAWISRGVTRMEMW